LKPRELEIVSMPANAAAGLQRPALDSSSTVITGLTPDGQRPSAWLTTSANRKDDVGPHGGNCIRRPRCLQSPGQLAPGGPTAPLAPRYPDSRLDRQAVRIVTLIDTPAPQWRCANRDVSAAPLNLLACTQSAAC
jgi:hypothetical protein